MTDPLVKACDLYPRTSRGPGTREHLVGYLGNLKMLIFRDKNPTEDGPTHALFIAARPAQAGPKTIASDHASDKARNLWRASER